MTNTPSFEEAIQALMEMTHAEEESINQDDELDDDQKQQLNLVLVGYRKGLQDILAVCTPREEGDTQE